MKKQRDAQPKSPAIRKTKEIHNIKMFAVQQHYKVSDFKIEEDEDIEIEEREVIVDEEEEKKPEDNEAEDEQIKEEDAAVEVKIEED